MNGLRGGKGERISMGKEGKRFLGKKSKKIGAQIGKQACNVGGVKIFGIPISVGKRTYSPWALPGWQCLCLPSTGAQRKMDVFCVFSGRDIYAMLRKQGEKQQRQS